MPPDRGTRRVLADERLLEILGRTVGEPGYCVAKTEEKSWNLRRRFQPPGAIVIVVSEGHDPAAGLHPPELVRGKVQRRKLGHQRSLFGPTDNVRTIVESG